VYRWEDTHAEHYPGLGWRLFGNCDIPDMTLFPARYPTLRSMRFGAGHELKLLHLGTRALGAWFALGSSNHSTDRRSSCSASPACSIRSDPGAAAST
jgi:hypothetical protein